MKWGGGKMAAVVGLYPVRAEEPSLRDNTGDVDRLRKVVAVLAAPKALTIPYAVLAPLAARFRQAGFAGWAVVNELPERAELVDFLPAPPTFLPAMALDLGTTHLEAQLLDLLSGRILATATLPNPQVRQGADILTRIHYATWGEGLAELHSAVVGAINDLALRLAAAAVLGVEEIRALAVSGNTTMVHLFLNLAPYHLCREPYIPLLNAPDPLPAAELGLNIHPAAAVWILPSVGSYFGGDLISGILAIGLDRQAETRFIAALEERNRESAEKIKSLMFTFDDLARLTPMAVQTLLRSVDKEKLPLALKGASEKLREMFFGNLSERAGKMLRDDIDALGAVKLREVDEAQAAIVAQAKELAAQGQIEISEGKDEEMVY